MTRSWDFWDTLVTRCVLAPSHVFRIVEARSGVAGFARARVDAETRSRAGVAETTLERIYQFLPHTTEERARLLREELEVELAIASGVRSNLDQLDPESVILSDMYLGREVLHAILGRCGVVFPRERILVSCEHGATKHTGELFDRARAMFAVSEHAGDNEHSDVRAPRGRGLRASHFRDAELNYVEEYWQRSGEPGTLIGGIARAARLAAPRASPRQDAEWRLFSGVVAPVLVGFVDWVLAEAARRRISRLYFLARDGQILHRIAAMMVQSRDLDLECRYLYGSRQALHLPGHVSLRESSEWLFDNTAHLSLTTIAGRMAASPESVRAAIGGLHVQDGENLAAPDRKKLLGWIERPAFVRLLEESAAREFEFARAYLAQEGVLEASSRAIGLVDVGWNARIQRSVESIVRKSGGRPEAIHGFYIGLADTCVFPSGERVSAYLSDPFREGHRHPWVDQHRAMFEFSLGATHPAVVAYRPGADGNIAPMLAGSLERARQARVAWQHDAILAFAERYCRMERLVGRGLAEGLSLAVTPLRRLIECPSCCDAAAFVDAAHTEQQAESHFVPLVKKLRPWDAIRPRRRDVWGLWPEGSFAVSRMLWVLRIRRVAREMAAVPWRFVRRRVRRWRGR